MEQVTQVIKEAVMEASNRKIENILRETFSPKRESICRECSLRPEFCFGSVADWHRCRYALRIRNDRVFFPSDQPTLAGEGEKREGIEKEMEELIVKTLQRVRTLTHYRVAVST
ncbi:MAG: hypothetical protein WED05_08280 [Candidatus Atabeyarchaeum deiterrae]